MVVKDGELTMMVTGGMDPTEYRVKTNGLHCTGGLLEA